MSKGFFMSPTTAKENKWKQSRQWRRKGSESGSKIPILCAASVPSCQSLNEVSVTVGALLSSALAVKTNKQSLWQENGLFMTLCLNAEVSVVHEMLLIWAGCFCWHYLSKRVKWKGQRWMFCPFYCTVTSTGNKHKVTRCNKKRRRMSKVTACTFISSLIYVVYILCINV